MRIVKRFACRNCSCSRYGEHRDGQGVCPACGWRTVLAFIGVRVGR